LAVLLLRRRPGRNMSTCFTCSPDLTHARSGCRFPRRAIGKR
jgi:hypothetical protein